MSRAQTPKGAFDSAAAASSELDAANRAGAPGSKPEIWKSKQPASGGGAWGQGAPSQPTKAGAMADGRDFLSVLASAKSSSSAAK
ncbi:hypothetical protein JCM10295v2_002898 [Rhodotorula toruloides]